jgi:hypothetical protein
LKQAGAKLITGLGQVKNMWASRLMKKCWQHADG